MKYLVTGATGGYGTYALGFLKELVPISDIAVLARTEEKAATQSGRVRCTFGRLFRFNCFRTSIYRN